MYSGSVFCRELDQYGEAYCQLKGMRTLEWKLNLGQVQVLYNNYVFWDG